MANLRAVFLDRTAQTRANPALLARTGLRLIDGAVRIRQGGDGLYGDVPKPATKQAEAIGAWLHALSADIRPDEPFLRKAELREALRAAGEEVGAATQSTPAASRYGDALYSDALDVIGSSGTTYHNNFWPWIVATLFGGILVGVLLRRK